MRTPNSNCLSITDELLIGAGALPLADRHHFDHNLIELLDKSTPCKKNWLLNVLPTKQRQARRQAAALEEQTLSLANSKLLKWMATGRAT